MVKITSLPDAASGSELQNNEKNKWDFEYLKLRKKIKAKQHNTIYATIKENTNRKQNYRMHQYTLEVN